MLESTALTWLDEQGGLTREMGRRLRGQLLSRGAVVSSIDPVEQLAAHDGQVAPFSVNSRSRCSAP